MERDQPALDEQSAQERPDRDAGQHRLLRSLQGLADPAKPVPPATIISNATPDSISTVATADSSTYLNAPSSPLASRWNAISTNEATEVISRNT